MASGKRSRRGAKAGSEAKGDRRVAGLEEAVLQRYAASGMRLLADETPRNLDPRLRTELEPIIGTDLGDVRLHTGERAQKMAEALGARAFAAGDKDVFFGRGEFNQDSAGGRSLLAHELTHVAEGHPGLARHARKPERQEFEGRARRAEELVLAKEEQRKEPAADEMREPQKVEMPSSGQEASSGEAAPVTIDKAELEDKTFQLMERLLRRERERTGV